jgi:hypothetical protein
MREIRLSGSEGGGGREASPYPYLPGNLQTSNDRPIAVAKSGAGSTSSRPLAAAGIRAVERCGGTISRTRGFRRQCGQQSAERRSSNRSDATHSVIPLPPTCSRMAMTSGRSRNGLDTPM